jgi:putative oxidoreductase
MHIFSVVLQLILGLAFFMSCFMKFGSKQQVEAFKHYGYPQGFRIVTGVVEVVGAIGLIVGIWYPIVATLAGLWLGVTMLCAVITHIRIKDPGKVMGAPIVLLILSVLVAVLN